MTRPAIDRVVTESLFPSFAAVVDEADQLVDMGFSDTLKHILSHLPAATGRQTFLFSATLTSSVRRLALISLKVRYDILAERRSEHTISFFLASS